ncbi:MAG: UvrD-helicase domain-containing protein [Rhodobacterales bacterium]|nr:UvrD-helicase domain-containing protein [Rhodobacterales bacterium]
MKSATHELVRAAAGTGKTVRLAQAFLQQLKKGTPIQQIIAITFTRKSAAELRRRVSDVLYAILDPKGSLQAAAAKQRLEGELELYLPHAPEDKDVIRRALAGIGAAPMGTIDSFVQRLLTEFNLDARLPVPDGDDVLLDYPLAANGDPARIFEDAAREVLDPPGSNDIPLSLTPLFAHYTLAELRAQATVPVLTNNDVTTARQLFEAISVELAATMQKQLAVVEPDVPLRIRLADYLLDGTTGADEVAVLSKQVSKRYRPLCRSVATWLTHADDAPPPAEFSIVVNALDTKHAVQLWDWLDGAQMAADAMETSRRTVGAVDVRTLFIDHFALAPKTSDWPKIASAKFKFPAASKWRAAHLAEVVTWLQTGNDDALPEALSVVWPCLEPGLSLIPGQDAKLKEAGEANSAAICAALRAHLQVDSARQWLFDTLPKGKKEAAFEAKLTGSVKKDGKSTAPVVAAWLMADEDDDQAPAALRVYLDNLIAKASDVTDVWAEVGDAAAGIQERIIAASGAPSCCDALQRALGLVVAPIDWPNSFVQQSNISTARATHVAAWVANGGNGAPPAGFVPLLWCPKKKGAHKRPIEALFGEKPQVPLPPNKISMQVQGAHLQLPLSDLCKDVDPRYFLEPFETTAETVRTSLVGLRKDVHRLALPRAARAGALGQDQFLSAAIALCEFALQNDGHPLRTRFSALLVDEVQDSSPQQVELYLTLAKLNKETSTFYVGDARQSIYLFRGAAPAALSALQESCTDGVPLLKNWRSISELVAAQKTLFGESLAAATHRAHLRPLESLAALEAGRSPAGVLRKPVTLICPTAPDQVTSAMADARALVVFATRVKDAWADDKPGELPTTAAVLSPTWKKAVNAVQMLREILGRDSVFLDGGHTWMKGRVVKDLRIILAALVKRSDQMAWLGLWKHPMVGLSDQALAIVRNKRGLDLGGQTEKEAGWKFHLGWMLEADELTAPHLQADIFAFARARDGLRTACAGIGKRPTSDVLAELIGQLHWSTVLAASPRDDEVAHLDLAMEWIRSMDQAGTTPDEILQFLSAQERVPDAPRLELHRPRLHVSCTTVFQSKGLQWQHVCVLSPGAASNGGQGASPPRPSQRLTLGDHVFELTPIRLDPAGAFEKVPDPCRKVMDAVATSRKNEECLRLAYVGITRAGKSVVTALPNIRASLAQQIMLSAWTQPDANLESVEIEDWIVVDEPALPRVGHVIPTEVALPPIAPPRRLMSQSPSTVEGLFDSDQRKVFAADIAKRVTKQNGYHRSPDSNLRSPVAGHMLAEPTLGTIVHGWLAVWGFRGEPERARIDAFLLQDWPLKETVRVILVDWLEQLSADLQARSDSPMMQLVMRTDVELYPEVPMVVPATLPGTPPLLLEGRADLLVRDPKAGVWTIIDFKAGSALPDLDPGALTKDTEPILIKGAKLRDYGPQLEAYRAGVNDALAARPAFANERVGDVALWFVRGGRSVRWSER